MKTISVIVPIYHGKQYISGMIRQMEACKKYLDEEDYLEVVFVNDDPDEPITLISEKKSVHVTIIDTDANVGIHAARIKGLKRSSGDYLLFLDQDDYIKPEYFFSQLASIGDSDAVVCQALHEKEKFYASDDVFKKMICKEFILGEWNSIISPGQVLLRKKSIPDIWSEITIKQNGGDDWFLWICMIGSKCSVSLNQEILYEHVLHGQNYSANLMKMLQTEQEVIRVVWERKILSEEDILLLLEGFFKRNENRVRELYSLKRKWYVFEQWTALKKNPSKLVEYLNAENICTVAVYGCGMLGEEVYNTLKESVEIKYFIDRNAYRLKKEIPVYSLEDKLPEADGIIITLIDDAEKVKKELQKISFDNVLILEDIIRYTKKDKESQGEL